MKMNVWGRNHNISKAKFKRIFDEWILARRAILQVYISGVFSAHLLKINNTGCWSLLASLVRSINTCYIVMHK